MGMVCFLFFVFSRITSNCVCVLFSGGSLL